MFLQEVFENYWILIQIIMVFLTLSWRRPLSYRNQSSDLLFKLMDWFLYDNGRYHERVKIFRLNFRSVSLVIFLVKKTTLWIRLLRVRLFHLHYFPNLDFLTVFFLYQTVLSNGHTDLNKPKALFKYMNEFLGDTRH